MWKTASEFMQRRIVTVTPNTTVRELIQIFDEEKIQAVPVVQNDDVPIGVVSRTDVLRTVVEEGEEIVTASPFYQGFREDLTLRDIWPPESSKLDLSKTVRQIMSDRVVSATELTSVGALAAIMLKEKVHRILITRNQKLVGLVSSMDLLRCVVEKEKADLLAQKRLPSIQANLVTTKKRSGSTKKTQSKKGVLR